MMVAREEGRKERQAPEALLGWGTGGGIVCELVCSGGDGTGWAFFSGAECDGVCVWWWG